MELILILGACAVLIWYASSDTGKVHQEHSPLLYIGIVLFIGLIAKLLLG